MVSGRFRNEAQLSLRVADRSFALEDEHSLEKELSDFVVEATFMKVITLFENALEELFLYLISGGCSLAPHVDLTVSCKSMEAARRLVVGDQYCDWLPLKKTLNRSRQFFKVDKSNPFHAPYDSHAQMIQSAMIVRNHIAHSSFSAEQEFKNLCSTQIPSLRELSASGYLKYDGGNGSRLQIHFNTFYRYLHSVEAEAIRHRDQPELEGL